MRLLHKVVSLVVLSLSSLWAVTPSIAQSSIFTDERVTRTISFQKSFTDSVAVTDTFFITLPQAPNYFGGYSFKYDTSASAPATCPNPPDNVQWGGRLGLRISVVSGTKADSMMLTIKAVDKDGNIIAGSDTVACISDSTTFAFDPIDYKIANTVFSPSAHGFAIIHTIVEADAAACRYRYDLSVQ